MEPATLAIIAKPATKLAGKLLKPLLSKFEKEVSAQVQAIYHRFVGGYTDYLENTVDRHSFFNSVVFKNEQRRLVDYYQSLTLVQSRTNEQIKIDHYPKSLVDEVRNILIVDTAGMGKTTLLKYLFLNCVNQEAGIPVFIELRKLSKKRTLLKFILEQLSDIEGSVAKELFFKLLASGEFVFFLDGYDEISEADRPDVTASIQQFMEKTRGNKFIMTSRDEESLAAFAQFQRYTIKPLQKTEAYSLLRKYSGTSGLADSLIEKLDLPKNRPIHEFLTNPLLTSLLFKSFEYKQIIPLKKHIFYRQVYESLFETHDLTKEGGEFQRPKRCGLDIDRFAKILKCLGALTYKAEKVEFTKEEALSFINSAKTLAQESRITPSDFLHDLTHTVPLLVPDGNYIRWNHKSIQEYFAAQFICEKPREKKIEILINYFNDPESIKHLNLIMLCADIDGPTFDQSIGSLIAEALLKEYNNSYANFGDEITPEILELRKSLATGKNLFYIRMPDFDEIKHDKEKIRLYTRTIHDRMRERCDAHVSTRISHASVSIGFAFGKIGQAIENFERSGNLSFILHNNRLGPKIKSIFANIDFLHISDDPANIANSDENFDAINNAIISYSDWRFDAGAAEEFLDKVRDELNAKQGVEPW